MWRVLRADAVDEQIRPLLWRRGAVGSRLLLARSGGRGRHGGRVERMCVSPWDWIEWVVFGRWSKVAASQLVDSCRVSPIPSFLVARG